MFGENDVHVILDLPENLTAAAISLAVMSTGAARMKTTVLLTPEEIDQAVKNPSFPAAKVAAGDWRAAARSSTWGRQPANDLSHYREIVIQEGRAYWQSFRLRQSGTWCRYGVGVGSRKSFSLSSDAQSKLKVCPWPLSGSIEDFSA